MAKRKYRQYTPGRSSGVTTTVIAIRETDLTEVDGKTRLKPGESIEFEFDLTSGIRRYTGWRNLMRQVADGACKLTLNYHDLEQGSGELEMAQVATHEISAQETTPELTREQEVIERAQAVDPSVLGVMPVLPEPTPVAELKAELPGPEQAGRVEVKEVKVELEAELPSPLVEPVNERGVEAREVAPVGTPKDLTPPEVEVLPSVQYGAPEAPAPTDYSAVKRPRGKKAK